MAVGQAFPDGTLLAAHPAKYNTYAISWKGSGMLAGHLKEERDAIGKAINVDPRLQVPASPADRSFHHKSMALQHLCIACRMQVSSFNVQPGVPDGTQLLTAVLCCFVRLFHTEYHDRECAASVNFEIRIPVTCPHLGVWQ